MIKYRFGFNATSTVRPQVIELCTVGDLLDDEICWLKRAGHLRVTRQELIIDTSRLMPMYGWFQVTLVSLVAAILQLAGLHCNPMEARSDPDRLWRNLVLYRRDTHQNVCQSMAYAQTSWCLESHDQIKLSGTSCQAR